MLNSSPSKSALYGLHMHLLKHNVLCRAARSEYVIGIWQKPILILIPPFPIPVKASSVGLSML